MLKENWDIVNETALTCFHCQKRCSGKRGSIKAVSLGHQGSRADKAVVVLFFWERHSKGHRAVAPIVAMGLAEAIVKE